MMRKIPILILLSLLLGVFCGCEKKEVFEPFIDESQPRITVIPSVSGLGDIAYNDKIMHGIMDFYQSHENQVSLSLQQPHHLDEVSVLTDYWIAHTSGFEGPCLLVLADVGYEEVLREMQPHLAAHQSILLLESKGENLPERVFTFRISRYGCSYLAGSMASPHQQTDILAACPTDPVLKEAIEGYSAGYSDHGGKRIRVTYLAEDAQGYAMPGSAYQWTRTLGNSFVFPLSGGSNNGIYKYSRETPDFPSLIVGMDMDCSYYSSRIPFSVVLNMDVVVRDLLEEWLAGGFRQQHRNFGLEDGSIEIVLSPIFYENCTIWEDYYRDPVYWRKACQRYYQEAVIKENEYENNQK